MNLVATSSGSAAEAAEDLLRHVHRLVELDIDVGLVGA
jgi:hypothetical protein